MAEAAQADLDALLHAQVKQRTLLARLGPYAAVLLVEVLLLSLVYPYAPPAQTLGWFALAIACLFLRERYTPRMVASIERGNAAWTRRMLVLFAVFNGAAMGSASLLFFAQLPELPRMIMTILMLGLATGSSVVMVAYLPVFLGYTAPLLLPLAWMWYAAGGAHYLIVSVPLVAFFTLLSAYVREYQHVQRESFAIRFEREQLVQELKQSHADLLAAKERAEEAGRAKARVLAAASHDLRQPLHALSIYSAVLASQPTQDTLAAVASHIDLSVRSLGALFNALLDVSRLDAGVFPVEKSVLDIAAVLQRICAEHAEQARGKGLLLECDSASALVHTDAIVVERVVRNIIDNAIKYTERGKVSVCTREIDGHVEIAIRDTGKGIPQEEQERIFEEFYQLGNPGRDREQGLGLGLSIVKRLVELIGSDLRLVSVPGQGSCFSWRLPLAQVAAAESPATNEADRTAVGVGNDTCILVIDDETEIRHGLALLLHGWGMTPLTAANETEAAELAAGANGAISLILSDLRLQDGVDGLRMVIALRERWGPIPVLLASGETDPAKLKEASASGFPLLHKPISPETLRRHVFDLVHQDQRQGSHDQPA